jgi:hypothetical protein
VHYEKMRITGRSSIRVLAPALQKQRWRFKNEVDDALNNEKDIVDWANWCILALRTAGTTR